MLVSLSTPSVPSPFTNRVKLPNQQLVAFEMGSLQLQNPAGGLLQQLWTLVCDGTNFTVYSPATSPELLLTDVLVSECDLAFDQNMFPFICYLSAGNLKYYWYDPVNQQFETVNLGLGYRTPRCTLDDKRPFDVSNSDVNFSYINPSNQLCYRLQRERYQTEHVLTQLTSVEYLDAVNFNTGYRLQWAIGALTTLFELIPLNVTVSNIVEIISGDGT